MRRAEWRRRADDPKGLLGWWWRGVVFEDRFLGFQVLGAVVTLVAWFKGFSWAMMPMATTMVLGKWVRRNSRPDDLAPMLPDPAPEGQFRTKVEYRQKGLATGRDEMALTVVDGWLHAEGVRSHFALRPEDVWKLTTGSDRRGSLVLSDGSEVRLEGLDDPARIVLQRWHRPDRWMESEPTFPPARIHPQELARRKVNAVVLAGAIGLPRFLAGLFPLHSLAGALVKFGSFIIVLIGMIVVWQRFWRLMQLEAEAHHADTHLTKALEEGVQSLQEETSESLTAKRL